MLHFDTLMTEKMKTAVKSVQKKTDSNPKKSQETMASSGKVVTGNKVFVEYVGTFDDGKIFDSSTRLGKPIEFVVGTGQVIKGFDKAVLGMKKGDETNIKLSPADAYGEHRKELEKVVLRHNLPSDREPKEGMTLLLGLANGHEVPARITKVNGDMVTIDLNHPLSGKTLNFKIKVVGIE